MRFLLIQSRKFEALSIILLIIFTLFKSSVCYALVQHEKAWFAINAQHDLTADRKWLSFLYSQARLINETYPWQTLLFEGGLGYRVFNNTSFWIGYRWSGEDLTHHFFHEDRLFQQAIFENKLKDRTRIIFRTRLEQIKLSNRKQISLRFRQRVALESNRCWLFAKFFPFIYDEVFFQLNRTDYTANRFSQNRLFVGYNYYLSKLSWLEIGYLNQYQMHTPLHSQNAMSHVLSFTYSFS